MDELIIHTSSSGWLSQLARAYRTRQAVVLVDDAQTGIDPATESLLSIGMHAKLGPREWVAASVALGMSAFGAWMVVAAVLDPDPTSKLWLMTASGAALCATGGWGAIRTLAHVRPPSVRVSRRGLEITWPS